MAQRLTLVEHAVLADRLSVLRDRETSHGAFRQALFEASAIMAVEAARELPVKEVELETPLERTRGFRLRDRLIDGGLRLCAYGVEGRAHVAAELFLDRGFGVRMCDSDHEQHLRHPENPVGEGGKHQCSNS